MIDSRLRSAYQKYLVDPVLSFPWMKNRRPLHITALSTLFGLAAAAFLAFDLSFWAVFFLLASGYFDTLDGSLARLQNTVSPAGAVLDISSDRLVEFSIILGFFLSNPLARALPCLLMLGSVLLCITSFLVVGIFSQNSSEKSFHYSPGLMERTEAFLFWIAMILFPAFFSPLAYTFSALVFFTAAARVKEFLLKFG